MTFKWIERSRRHKRLKADLVIAKADLVRAKSASSTTAKDFDALSVRFNEIKNGFDALTVEYLQSAGRSMKIAVIFMSIAFLIAIVRAIWFR